jgi:hypothetical protein
MNPPPPNLISLDERRRAHREHHRAHRALLFVAAMMGRSGTQDVTSIGLPITTVKHLSGLGIDLGVTRAPAPTHSRAAIAFARRRQNTFMLIRLRDPAPGFAEILLDVIMVDQGVAILEGLSPVTSDGRRFWLCGRHPGDVHLRLTNDGPVPTLSDPWVEEEDRFSFMSKADELLAAVLWADSTT